MLDEARRHLSHGLLPLRCVTCSKIRPSRPWLLRWRRDVGWDGNLVPIDSGSGTEKGHCRNAKRTLWVGASFEVPKRTPLGRGTEHSTPKHTLWVGRRTKGARPSPPSGPGPGKEHCQAYPLGRAQDKRDVKRTHWVRLRKHHRHGQHLTNNSSHLLPTRRLSCGQGAFCRTAQ